MPFIRKLPTLIELKDGRTIVTLADARAVMPQCRHQLLSRDFSASSPRGQRAAQWLGRKIRGPKWLTASRIEAVAEAIGSRFSRGIDQLHHSRP
jgi:hypothetical protein